MKLTPPRLASSLAILIACLVPIDATACDSDIHSGSMASSSADSSPGSLMSMLPAPEAYERGGEYPGPVREKATKWSGIFGIPSSWLIPLGHVESHNQPMAQNKSGATGAAQIKLARARDLVAWLSRSKWKTHLMVQGILVSFWHGLRDDLLNLDLNIMLAAFELHHLRQRFGNHPNIIYAAYNQGEGRISRCLERRQPLPPRAIEFIQRVVRAKQQGYT